MNIYRLFGALIACLVISLVIVLSVSALAQSGGGGSEQNALITPTAVSSGYQYQTVSNGVGENGLGDCCVIDAGYDTTSGSSCCDSYGQEEGTSTTEYPDSWFYSSQSGCCGG